MVLDSGTTTKAVFLQPPPGKRYVRSFLFSRRVDAPLARIHLIARTVLILCISSLQLRTIDTAHPDPVNAALLWLLSLFVFVISGMNARVARLYFLLTLPTLLSLLMTWLLFNPVAGQVTLVRETIYSGQISIGVALWQVIWIAIVVGYFLWRRHILVGILLATLVAVIATRLFPLPSWTITEVAFFRPLTLVISDRGLLVAVTKVVGYSGMILGTISLVVCSRDAELIGALRQLHLPQAVIFFLGTVFRALNLTLSDYDTIRQAQLARAINARPRSIIRRLRDLGSIAVPLVAVMIRRSGEIGDALMARGYRLGQPQSDFYETIPLRTLDWLIFAVSLLLLFLALGPYINVTTLLLTWF